MTRSFPVSTETYNVLQEIAEERTRQDATFGDQSQLPDVDPTIDRARCADPARRIAREYDLPMADEARAACESAMAAGELSWAHILVEEVAEAIEAAWANIVALRVELVQVAAVATAWAEALDKRIAAQDAALVPGPVQVPPAGIRWDVV